ncbi:sigma 54-interacting transcriptional regulator [Desulforhopalus sp. IMCC35007]|uniref:sigma 54-interacting transcriptional regulator n=1 Tax=Desulforhopalus sp. IMCC35007 TaxID=2569543 RepID=UPI0010AE1ED1|nr:sigma 54-interacting transcriptional regulator [Desulforhopalus sp. IMCC35007]TKB05844.1 PAS domain-containing protein [Desulforhopalus sp. IMCC35007]
MTKSENANFSSPQLGIHGMDHKEHIRLQHCILDSTYNPILAVDADGKILFCNQAMARNVRSDVVDMLGKNVEEFFSSSRLRMVLQSGKTEAVQKTKIGGKVYMSNRTPILDEGRVIGAVAVLQDVSELESIADELEQTKRLNSEMKGIIDSCFDGIYVTDGKGRTIRVNTAYERITGIRREDVLNRTTRELVDEGFFSESVTLLVLESKRPKTLMQTVKTGRRVMATGTPIIDKDGEVSLVVTSVRDVSELYNLQKRLIKEEQLRTEYQHELEKLRQIRDTESTVVIKSKKMQEINKLAIRLAQVDTTIMVHGESGVGKEVFADLVHKHSPRRDKPCIKISCVTIPEHLFESELFGYAPAAFTGASKHGKVGIFEAAKGGTIFLDEIGEMPLPAQAKLLRVLQSKEVTRVGSNTVVPVDVRIVAATNRDLKKMVASGQFRKDLFFRLNVVPVVIPPLRERKEAIPTFVYHFLEKFNQQYGFSKQLSPRAHALMYDHDWPGNVRELINTIERIVVTTGGDIISVKDLPENIRSGHVQSKTSVEEGSLRFTLEKVEKQIIEDALKTHGSTHKTARALGVNQSTIVRKMKRYGLS